MNVLSGPCASCRRVRSVGLQTGLEWEAGCSEAEWEAEWSFDPLEAGKSISWTSSSILALGGTHLSSYIQGRSERVNHLPAQNTRTRLPTRHTVARQPHGRMTLDDPSIPTDVSIQG